MAAQDDARGDRVDCPEHGTCPAALVCRHLTSGSGLSFNWGIKPGKPDAVCPDAWCDSCSALMQEEGECNERVLAAADMQRVCDRCYEDLRERHWIEKPGELQKLVRRAIPLLEERQQRLQQEFGIGAHERYDWDQDAGQLVFSSGGKVQLIADIVFVGSVSTRSHTWLWSWANQSILESVKGRMRELRRYGEQNRIIKLAAARWNATERDGWEMTAIASLLLGAQGAYRTPGRNGCTFMVMTRVTWAQ